MQTIRLTYEPGLTLVLKLFDTNGDAVGVVDGYALTESASGEYQCSVADGLTGSPLVAVLEVGGEVEATDYVWLTGEADSVAIVGIKAVDVSEITAEIEREGGMLDSFVPATVTGPSSLEVRVKDSVTGVLIPDASILVAQGVSHESRTSETGSETFTVVNGPWSVSAAARGYAGQSVDVSVPLVAPLDIALVRTVIPTSGSLETCMVTVFVKYKDGRPVERADVSVTLVESGSTPVFKVDSVLIDSRMSSVTIGGSVSFRLTRGVNVEISVSKDGATMKKWRYLVPDKESDIASVEL